MDTVKTNEEKNEYTEDKVDNEELDKLCDDYVANSEGSANSATNHPHLERAHSSISGKSNNTLKTISSFRVSRTIQLFELIGVSRDELSNAFLHTLEHYNRGLYAYKKKDFKLASQSFARASRASPEDVPSRMMLKRSIYLFRHQSAKIERGDSDQEPVKEPNRIAAIPDQSELRSCENMTVETLVDDPTWDGTWDVNLIPVAGMDDSST